MNRTLSSVILFTTLIQRKYVSNNKLCQVYFNVRSKRVRPDISFFIFSTIRICQLQNRPKAIRRNSGEETTLPKNNRRYIKRKQQMLVFLLYRLPKELSSIHTPQKCN
ncbi:ribosomal protein S17E [Bacteroides pyogenes]|nr:ribosomal protein S17E [Bacteroides pyogenes]